MLTKVLLIPAMLKDEKLSETEREFFNAASAKTNVALLSKIWQMLIKGLNEVQNAPVPIDALEMVLIRIAYSANLPTPAELLESVKKKSSVAAPINSVSKTTPQPTFSSTPPPASTSTFAKINDFVHYLEENKQLRLAYTVKNDIEVVEFTDGIMKFKATERVSADVILTINKFLEAATGKKWKTDLIPGEVILSIANIENAQKEADKKNVAENPLVKEILNEFKGAKIETLMRKVASGENGNFEENNDEFVNEDFN